MNDPALVVEFGVPSTGAGGQDGVPGGIEGYLFPDTYQFPLGTEPAVILHRMRSRLDEVLTPRLRKRLTQLGWDLHRTLTLASIIEKETGARVERPRISAVFHNRLRKRMKLQTDPTVVYGVADHDGDIKRSDLQREHAYNTY
ncbi:MAG: endolytic transglycosylase MltG, partial [bacterium]